MTTVLTAYEQRLAAGMTPDADQRAAAQALEDLRQRLAAAQPRGFFRRAKVQPGGGVYLWGGVGRGKTTLMDMFFNTASGVKKRRVHFHAFMLEVHDFLHRRRQSRGRSGMDSALLSCADHIADQARLLCFDEFQVRDVADAMILGRLFTALFDRGVSVVMTSNIALDDLYMDGLQRDRFLPFIALLKERMVAVHFKGEADYRLNRIAGMKTYFWPADDDAAEQLEYIFQTVAEDVESAPQDIAFRGRVLHVPRAAREVAQFSFGDLCLENKSAADYLELVRHFRLFIVTDVPQMDDNRRDAALRFATLVDTLYDHQARIALSAAVPPERLYKGEMHAAVFARTVSRLIEMQSKGYGGRSAHG